MKIFYLAFLVAVAIAANAAVSIKEVHPIDWYDCRGKVDGNYEHPTSCNHFISCSGGIASERDCAACHYDPVRCPDRLLVYNATVDQCLWADQTTCGIGSGGGSTGPTETPTPPPVEGECDPALCKNNGTCQHYTRCDNGRLVREECGVGLVWNPLNADGTPHIHGGNCDVWENLRPEIEHQYRSDQECLACFWRSLGECERNYLYQAPFLKHRNVQTLSCAEGLVFSMEKETCQRCSDAKKANGTPCCTAS